MWSMLETRFKANRNQSTIKNLKDELDELVPESYVHQGA